MTGWALCASQVRNDDEDGVLHHTLYRFLCLFGPPDEADASIGNEETPVVCDSDAWRAVRAWLDSPGGRTRYSKDRASYSAFDGKNKHLAEAQKRITKLPGAAEMLKGLTHFDAHRRWSVRRALTSRLFEEHRGASVDGVAAAATLHFVEYLDDDATVDGPTGT